MQSGQRSDIPENSKTTRREAIGLGLGAAAAPFAAAASPGPAEVAAEPPPAPRPAALPETLDVAPHFLEAVARIERIHRRQLDVITDEFDRRKRTDVNSVQALLIYNIGEGELTAGELRTRGHYLGSTMFFNLKKLIEAGHVSCRRSKLDRRSFRVSLTERGFEVRDIVAGLFAKHVRTIEQVGGVNADDLNTLNVALERLENFWTDQIRFRL